MPLSTRTQSAVQPIGEGIPTYVTLFISALTFMMLWIIAVQIIVLVTGALVQAGMIHTHGPWFVDEHGRTVLLRGVNLSGSGKVPSGMPTRVRDLLRSSSCLIRRAAFSDRGSR
jgi:hypothetical protein